MRRTGYVYILSVVAIEFSSWFLVFMMLREKGIMNSISEEAGREMARSIIKNADSEYSYDARQEFYYGLLYELNKVFHV